MSGCGGFYLLRFRVSSEHRRLWKRRKSLKQSYLNCLKIITNYYKNLSTCFLNWALLQFEMTSAIMLRCRKNALTPLPNPCEVFADLFSVPLSGVLGLVLVYVWNNVLSSTEDKYLSQYHTACYAIVLSCIIDQMTQCVVLIAQSYCFVKLKIVFETIYILTRTATFVILVLRYPNYAIHVFSIAQVTSAITLCLLYYGFFAWYTRTINEIRAADESRLRLDDQKATQNTIDFKEKMFADMQDFRFESILDFFPGHMKNFDSPLNKELLVLTMSFVKQCVVKQVLTEGERYVMTISPVLTFSQQSMYDIVNNLGSLAARFIFRPIEDSAYFYFTQMIKREVPLQQQDQVLVTEAAAILSKLCKVVTSVGLVVVVFGHTYSHTLLYLYGGHTLVSTDLPTILLKCHCIAVLLLAINGVTECYVFATMNTKQLDRYNYIMVVFSISFLLLSYILTNWFGPVGFIFANCLNMAARILHSIYFIDKKYKETKHRPLEGLKPGIKFAVVLVLSGIVTKVSEKYFLASINIQSVLLHIFTGGVCFAVVGFTWAHDNKNLLKEGIDKYRRRVSLKVD